MKLKTPKPLFIQNEYLFPLNLNSYFLAVTSGNLSDKPEVSFLKVIIKGYDRSCIQKEPNDDHHMF